MVAGGMATVRGYSEGLLIGRSGYILSAEMLFPILPRTIKSKDKTKEYPFLGTFMKGFVFADHAGIFPYKGTGEGSQGYNQNDFLMSLGFGFRFNLPKDINLRIAWGFPVMRNNHEEVNKCGRFHIELSLTPDFDALVKLRKPKNKNIEHVRNIEENPLKKEDIKVLANSDDKVKNKRSINEYLTLSNKDLAEEIVKPKTKIELNNIKKQL